MSEIKRYAEDQQARDNENAGADYEDCEQPSVTVLVPGGIATSTGGAFEFVSYEEHDTPGVDEARSAEETGEGESGGEIARLADDLPSGSIMSIPLRGESSNVRELMRPVESRFPAVRQALLDALAEYDRGELVGVAIIKERTDSLGSVHSGGKLMLLAGCSRLAHQLNLSIDES